MQRKAIYLAGVLLLLNFAGLEAQDIHYSQFYNAPFVLNPGLTGVFGGSTRFMGNYRSQWSSVPVGYQTFSAAADHNFFGRRYHPGFFSAGLAFNYDRAGDSRLSMVNVAVNGAYTRKLSPNIYATLGVQFGWLQRSFDTRDLTFDNQYDGNQFDPGIDPTDPILQLGNNNFADLSTGLNLRWQAATGEDLIHPNRSKVDVGIGIFHLNRPDQSFESDITSLLPMRFSPYVSGTFQLGAHSPFDLVAGFSTQIQKPYNESVATLGGALQLCTDPGRQLAVQLGLVFRFHEISDAVGPAIELHYNNWRFGFSYDANVSAFNLATQRRSGPEISVHYVIKNVPPLFKVCTLM